MKRSLAFRTTQKVPCDLDEAILVLALNNLMDDAIIFNVLRVFGQW